jgi:hypothetical protein
MGKTLYDQFGFHDEFRFERRVRNSPPPPASASCAPILPRDLDRIAEFDAAIFGADRGPLLASLLRNTPGLCFQTDGGFVMGRPGATATQIGPLVATDRLAAERLLHAVLRLIPEGPALLDVPLCNAEADQLSTRLGFQKQRELIRQYRGPNCFPGDYRSIFASAGPDLG